MFAKSFSNWFCSQNWFSKAVLEPKPQFEENQMQKPGIEPRLMVQKSRQTAAQFER